MLLGKGGALERGNYRRLNLTSDSGNIERAIEMLIRQHWTLLRCSLVSRQNVRLQTSFLSWDRRNI